jgi:transcriptional regulator with XRE-family HTH domain
MIKELREAKGLTQPDLGRAIGVATQTILRWEKDRCVPSIVEISKLANILGEDVDTFANAAFDGNDPSREAFGAAQKMGIVNNDFIYEALTSAGLEVGNGDIFHHIYSFLKSEAEQSGNRVVLDLLEDWLYEKYDTTKNIGENRESLKIEAFAKILDLVREKAKYTKHEDRYKAAQILKWAIEELEAPEVERLNERMSDGVAG